MITFRRPRGFDAQAGKYEKLMRKAVMDEMLLGLDLVLEAIEDTPVYTGRTIINYRFSVGRPIEGTRSPIAKPDLPGKTSEMEIGKEPRRGANWSVVLAEYAAVRASIKQNPYQAVFLTNNAPYFLEVEYGTYNTSEGHSQRTPPGGMVRRAETALSTRIKR